MLVQASAHQPGTCVSSQAAKAAQRAPKLAFPKQLVSAAAVLTGGAAAAGAQPIPYGPPSAVSAAAAQAPELSAPSVSLPSVSLPPVDMPDVAGLVDSAGGVSPLLIGGAVAAVAIPIAIAGLVGGGAAPGKVKGVSASKAAEALAADEYVVLLDIRSKADVREQGSPNLKGLSRRGAVSVPYTSLVKGAAAVDEAFGSKVARVKGVEAGGAPIILLDKSGSQAPAAAKAILKEVAVDRIFYVQGGADAWKASGSPWKEAGAGLSFGLPDLSLGRVNLSGTTKTIAGGVQQVASSVSKAAEAPPTAKGVLAALGVVGASALLFSQVELLLELAGLLAVGQFLIRVLYAEDRERTLTEIKRVAEKVDVEDLPKDLTKVVSTLLEDPTSGTTSKKVSDAQAVPSKQPAPAPKPVPVASANGGGPSASPARSEA